MSTESASEVYLYPSLPEIWESVVLPIDKPAHWSSYDVIRKLKRITRTKKIGHAGTLDPMATGLLICLFGRSTKRLIEFQEQEKTYTGELRLGQETSTYDAESAVIREASIENIRDEDLERAKLELTGSILQLPPMFSAVKVEGRRLYKLARKGVELERQPRPANVYEFTFVNRSGSDIEFRIRCSKGTYVRTLAHDLGQKLNVGAHLISLRRIQIGQVSVDSAWKIEELEKALIQAISDPG